MLNEYNEVPNQRCGTILYMAPEQLSSKKYTTVILLHYLVCGYMGNWNYYLLSIRWGASIL